MAERSPTKWVSESDVDLDTEEEDDKEEVGGMGRGTGVGAGAAVTYVSVSGILSCEEMSERVVVGDVFFRKEVISL